MDNNKKDWVDFINNHINLVLIISFILMGIGLLFFTIKANATIIYEQNFDELTDGDLTGQDNWVTNVLFDVKTETGFNSSIKDVNIYNLNNSVGGYRAFSGVDTGEFFIAIKQDSITNVISEVRLNQGITEVINVHLGIDGDIRLLSSGGTWNLLYSDYLANTWYYIDIQFDDINQDNKYRARIYDGLNWTDWSSWYNTYTNYTFIDRIYIWSSQNGHNYNSWFDEIGNTNIVSSPPIPTPTPTPTPWLSIHEPYNNSTTTDNFGQWWGSCVSYENYGYIKLLYGNENPGTNNDKDWDYNDGYSTKCYYQENATSTGKWYINRVFDLATSTPYYARAVLWGTDCDGEFPGNQTCNEEIYATSATITFQLKSDIAEDKIYLDILKDYNTTNINQPGNIEKYTDIANRFPFAWFYDLKNIYTKARTYSENQFPSLTLKGLDILGDEDFVIISSSTLATWVGTGNLTFFKGLFTATLWLGFGYYIFSRIKGLDER